MNVTVVITNRDYGDLVPLAIQSSIHQTVHPRVVVVDDASSDSSMELYKEFDGKIEVIRRDGDVGPSQARNAGIRYAWDNTDIFAFLDADDYYLRPSSVSRLVNDLTLSPRIGLSYSDCDMFDETTGRLVRIYKEPFSPERMATMDIVGGNFAVTRKAIEVAGKFNEEMKVVENYELARRISQKFIPSHVPENLVSVRRTNRSLLSIVAENEWRYYWQKATVRAHG